MSEQLKQILEVVGKGRRGVNTSYQKQQQYQNDQAQKDTLRATEEAKTIDKIREGIWHDPRLDCIAGNGVMSELGIGDEWFGAADADPKSFAIEEIPLQNFSTEKTELGSKEGTKKQTTLDDLTSVEAMPIVILRGFDSRGGGARREELLEVLTQWAASLAENQVRSTMNFGRKR